MLKIFFHLIIYVFLHKVQNRNIDNGVKSYLKLVKALGNDARENHWSCL